MDTSRKDTSHSQAMPGMEMGGMDMGGMQMDGLPRDSSQKDTAHTAMAGMDMGDMPAMQMQHSFSLSLPMNRNSSGTSWLPDATPMYGYMLMRGKWMFMGHGSVFIRYNSQNIGHTGSHADSKLDAPNWFMVMGQRQVGANGLFHFSVMGSLDPLTVGGSGSPLLFQTGESWHGQELIDHQHPHDLFSELAVAYTQRLSSAMDLTGYLGYPGEPALGPGAFMHRASAMNDPDAPIGHHWQDATHITFGVATLGLRYKLAKLEASLLNGHEPDENRYAFQEPKFNSWAVRLSVNPIRNLAVQVSHGYLVGPEALHPNENVHRTTASLIYSGMVGPEGNLNTTICWGYNQGTAREHSLLLESNLRYRRWNGYGRYEWVQKSAEELVLPLSDFPPAQVYSVQLLTLGSDYIFYRVARTNFALGLQGSVNLPDAALQGAYGKLPLSAQVYVKISPGQL